MELTLYNTRFKRGELVSFVISTKLLSSLFVPIVREVNAKTDISFAFTSCILDSIVPRIAGSMVQYQSFYVRINKFIQFVPNLCAIFIPFPPFEFSKLFAVKNDLARF